VRQSLRQTTNRLPVNGWSGEFTIAATTRCCIELVQSRVDPEAVTTTIRGNNIPDGYGPEAIDDALVAGPRAAKRHPADTTRASWRSEFLPTASCPPCPKVPAQLNPRLTRELRLQPACWTRKRGSGSPPCRAISCPAERAIPAPPGRSASSRRVFGLSSDVVGEVGGATDGCWMHPVFFADNCNHQHSVTPGQLTLAFVGPSGDLGDHAALAKAGSTSSIRSNRCPNPAPSVPL
jgi:hypothetical protein